MDDKKEYKEHLSVWRMLQLLVLTILVVVTMIMYSRIEILEKRIEITEISQKRITQTLEIVTDVLESVAKK